MARTWLQIRVELKSGRDIVCKPRPGRIFLVGPSHSFEQLADAINLAFARWDLGHLHKFELADGREIGQSDDDFPLGLGWLDQAKLKVAQAVKPGDRFDFIFDMGDDWRHSCDVMGEKVNPAEEFGAPPARPVPIWGWGWIPDQYGRRSFADLNG